MIQGLFQADEFSVTYDGKTIKGKIADLNEAQFAVFADANKRNITLFNDVEREAKVPIKYEDGIVSYSYDGVFYPKTPYKMDGDNIIEVNQNGEPLNVYFTRTFDGENMISTMTKPFDNYVEGVGVVKAPKEIVIAYKKV